jgi:hypothetical protein
MSDEHPKSPIDAHREGLEQLERAPHHATTGHDKPLHPTPPAEPPGDEHRHGAQTNIKR